MQNLFYPGLAVLVLAFASATATQRTSDEIMQKLTPVIFVERVEPCIAFWIERLGFEKRVEVPEGDHIGFAGIGAGNVEIMYQSRASVVKDIPTLAEGPFQRSGVLFIEVSDLDAVKMKLQDADLIFPERITFYGAREIAVRAPCGTAVIFAEMTEG